jgi:L-cysteine desulfidase
MLTAKITLRHPEPWAGGRASSAAVDERTGRHTEPCVIHAVSVLNCLDAQMRAVEPDARSLADTDRVVRSLSLAELRELFSHLSQALALIRQALK